MRLFYKKRLVDGTRILYFLGAKIYSYKVKKISEEEIFQRRISEARNRGVKIGDNVKLIDEINWGNEPWFIEIGNDVMLSFDITFLTHDGCIWAYQPYFKDFSKISKFGKIKIGNGCFIGCKTTIMPNVTIGDNCITAACSVVTKNIPDGEVWGGVPAKFICKTQELATKIENNSQTKEQQKLRDYLINLNMK